MSARVLQVIEETHIRGNGTVENRTRVCKTYWDFDGNLLADYDPFIELKIAEESTQNGRPTRSYP